MIIGIPTLTIALFIFVATNQGLTRAYGVVGYLLASYSLVGGTL